MKHVGLLPSVYYYREKSGRKGCLTSKQTLHYEHGNVSNEVVVELIEKILSKPFQDYWGYHNITAELRELGYRINHKKVYRLMKEAKLLKPSARLRPEKVVRKFVKFRKVITQRPLECVEMDTVAARSNAYGYRKEANRPICSRCWMYIPEKYWPINLHGI